MVENIADIIVNFFPSMWFNHLNFKNKTEIIQTFAARLALDIADKYNIHDPSQKQAKMNKRLTEL